MRNWLGQEINVGGYVYRGARQGDSSEYKIGIVTKVTESTRKVTVKWFARPSSISLYGDQGKVIKVGVVGYVDSSGTSDIDTMISVPPEVAEFARVSAEIHRAAVNNLPKMKDPAATNSYFQGYFKESDYRAFVNYELAERGFTV
jgi:hypothetical protein